MFEVKRIKVMLHDTRRFATTIYGATRRYNIVGTLNRMVATLFQHCNAVANSPVSN